MNILASVIIPSVLFVGLALVDLRRALFVIGGYYGAQAILRAYAFWQYRRHTRRLLARERDDSDSWGV